VFPANGNGKGVKGAPAIPVTFTLGNFIEKRYIKYLTEVALILHMNKL
jgi:hypothetical protein